MGRIIRKQIQGMSLWAKVSLITTLTLLVSVFMYQGWYKPQQAQAAIAVGSEFTTTNIYSATGATSMTFTGNYTVGAGTNRLLLIAVQIEGQTGGTYTPGATRTWGGQTLTYLGGTTSGLRTITAIYYMKEAQIAAAGSTALSIPMTFSLAPSAVAVRGAWFTGVDQTTPISNFQIAGNDAPGATTHTWGTNLAVLNGDRAYFFETTNAGVTITNNGSFTEAYDANDATANYALAAAYKVITANGNELPTITQSAATRYSVLALAIKPSVAVVNPTVTSATPNNQTQGTGPTTVTITGTGFQAGAVVTFSGTGVTAGASTFVSATSITVPVTVTAGATTGARTITVTNTDTGAGTGGTFTVNAAPTITTVTPNTRVQGSAAASVTITGTNLTGGAVTFSNPGVTGGAPTVANATTITLPVTVTAGATAAAGTVTVTTGSGSVNSAFTVSAAPTPTVTTTSPNNMTQGTGPTTISINGTNFLDGATVTFSGTGVTADASTFVSATQLTVPVTVTAGAATGARTVTVTLPGGQVSTGGVGAFTVNVAATPPTITTVSPNTRVQGSAAASVTITGTNLTGGAVTFSNPGVTGGAPTVANATTITLPVTVTPGATAAAGTLTVTTGSGSVNSAFTVTAAPTPTVTTTSPNNMNQGTGPTTITINGTNFLTGATVTFSGTGVTAGASTFVSATQLTVPVTVTAGAATGARTVTVTLPGGQVSTGGVGAFTVNAAACVRNTPTVTMGAAGSITPGGNKIYTVTITNNDTGSCAATTFTIARGTETGNTAGFVIPSVVAPLTTGALTVGQVYSGSTLTVVAQAGATAGQALTTPVTAADATNHAAQTGSGSVVTTVTTAAAPSLLVHNSINIPGTKGTWGTAYNCATCHSTTTTNIKRVAQTITTPIGARPVTFTRMTANRSINNATTIGVFGNDVRTYNVNNSVSVCSVCHHNTVHHQYSTSSAYAGYTKVHYNNQDCTGCHFHSAAFAKSGSSHATTYPGATHMVGLTAGAYTACTGCHTLPSGTYPAVSGPPACTSCHINAANFNSATAGCADCHGTNTDGRPNGAAFPNNARSHAAPGHTLVCNTCHTGAGTGTVNHGNSGKNVRTINDVTVSFASGVGSWNVGGLTCSATLCHGGSTVTWGTTLTGTVAGCDKCHSNAAAATFRLTDATTNTPKSIIHVSHLNNSHNMKSTGVVCSACHTIPATAAAAGHFDSPLPGDVVLSPGTYSGTYPSATCANTYCHGSTLKGNLTPNTPDATVVMSPTFGTTLLTGVATNDCGRCHGFPPKASYHIKVAVPLTYYALTDCKGCHGHVNAAGTGFETTGLETIALHINGIVEGGSCLGCHNSVKGGRAAVVSQMNSGNLVGNSHHVQGVALVESHCYQCHMEADSAGKQTSYHGGTAASAVNLVVYGANGVRGTSFVSYTASLNTRASITKLNLVCLGCHNATNTTYAAGTLNVTARNYFNDGKAPNNFAWDSTKTSIDTRYSNAATVAWSSYAGATPFTATNQAEINIYGGNKKNLVTKALSAHGNAGINQRGYSHNVAEVTTTAVGVDEGWLTSSSATSKVACMDCHNSHGSSVTGTVTDYTPATTTGGILKDVIAGQGGYTVTYKPYSGGSVATKNKHTAGAGLCFDCHNTLNANTLTKNVGGTLYNSPWGYSGTFGSAQPIYGFFDYPDFGTGSNGSQLRYPVKNLGASAGNKGGHFGASSTLSAALDGARTGGNGINGVCTNCHDPHGVTSDTTKVTATKYGVPLLKGNWMTSPYREDAPPASTTKTRGGGDGIAAIATASIPRYRIDQNTFGATTTGFSGGGSLGAPTGNGTGGAAPKWTFTMPAGVTETAAQFGGLCLSSASGAGATGCHVEANIKNTVAANAAGGNAGTWKSMTRIHNSVKGWNTGVVGGGNAGNIVHAYTCSKCHSPHTSNLPRLLVTNCLDWKHRSKLATGGSISSTSGAAATGNQNRGVTNCGMGTGRFPGGGARYLAVATGNTRNSNSGPWFFGIKRTATGGAATTGYTFSAQPCHDSATAGGAYSQTNYPTSQLWNTKSTW